jgi:hypothetical protein
VRGPARASQAADFGSSREAIAEMQKAGGALGKL